MIAEWFLDLAAWFVEWIGVDVMGEWEPPDELVQATDAVNGVLATFAGLGVWVDWVVVGICVTAAVSVWVAVLLVKLGRAVVAHVPGFGGAGD